MADQWTLPLYPPAGGTIIPGMGEPLFALKTATTVIAIATETDIHATAIHTENCTSLTLFLEIEFGTGPVTDWDLLIYSQKKDDPTVDWGVAAFCWDISDKRFNLLGPVQYKFGIEGKYMLNMPTYGAPTIFLRENAAGVNTGSYSKVWGARGWAPPVHATAIEA